jgi:predicted lipid-binding transport protein (Tim44 family)
MMLGGGLMFGMGLLVMLLVIGIPILLVIALLSGAAGFLNKRNRTAELVQQPGYAASNPVAQSGQAVVTPARYCAHCGVGLQADWTHCPQCGAPLGGQA